MACYEKNCQTISVIIPTLNEEGCLEKALDRIKGRAGIEVIVVDGGSSDSTISIAQQYAHKVVKTPPSRGKQLKQGVEASRSDVLLFLHADSLLPQDWDKKIRDSLKDEGVIGGAFSLAIEPSSFLLHIIARVANIRSRMLGIVYGDQGMFVRRDVLKSIGGIKDLPLFEDVDLWERMKKEGRLIVLDDFIITSSRRWERQGVLKTTMKNWFFCLLHSFGISASTLYKFYYGKKL